MEESTQTIAHIDSQVRRKLQKNSIDYTPNSLPITHTSVRRLMTKNKEKEKRKPPKRYADESTCFNVLVQTDSSLRKSLRLMSTAIHSTTTEFCNFRSIKVAPVHTEVAAVTEKKSNRRLQIFVWAVNQYQQNSDLVSITFSEETTRLFV